MKVTSKSPKRTGDSLKVNSEGGLNPADMVLDKRPPDDMIPAMVNLHQPASFGETFLMKLLVLIKGEHQIRVR